MLILRQRLRAVMDSDPNAVNGIYQIRSLYFDTPDDKALREKLDGAGVREKYRIRLYNEDCSFIRLERKFKSGGVGCKNTAVLTKEQVIAIINGDIAWMADSDSEVINDFYKKILHQRLSPKAIVDYKREPFVFKPGNVRVTLDYDIRTGINCADFLNFESPTIRVPANANILEVKWDEYLPDIIKDAVFLEGRRSNSFSKYAACRMYD